MENIKKPAYSDLIYFGLYTFILMFAPPILPKINILFLLSFFSLVMLLIKYHNIVKQILKIRTIQFTILLYFLFLSYASVVMLVGMGLYHNFQSVIFTGIYRYFILIPSMWICIIYLLSVFLSKKWGTRDIIPFFLMGGMFEFFLTLLAFISPNIKQTFIDIMYKNTGQQVFSIKTLNVDSTTVRFFGFANTLLDSFGYCMGILAVVALFIGITYRRRYIVISFCLLFTTTLNSRTGLIIFFIGLLLMLVFWGIKGEIKLLFRVLGVLIILWLLFITIGKIFSAQDNATWDWIISGFSSIFSIFTGRQTSTYDVADVLFSDSFWVLPKGLPFIFGSGYEVTSTLNGLLTFHSDVGYINLIWQFGIIGLLAILLQYMYMFTSSIKKSSASNRFICLFLLVIFLFVMIKFDATNYTPGTPVLIILLLVIILESEAKKNGS